MSEESSHKRNRALASLSPADFQSLLPNLRVVPLTQRTILYSAGEQITRVYFPHTGVVSLVVQLSTGQEIEAAILGLDSCVGASAAMNGRVAVNKAIVQIAGAASWVSVDRLRALADKSRSLRTTIMHQEQLVLVQAQQAAACNATHLVEQRLAKWLVRCQDLMESRELLLTQEFLGVMLGVRRTSVSGAARVLQDRGVISYNRGTITVLSDKLLKAAACECYSTIANFEKKLQN